MKSIQWKIVLDNNKLAIMEEGKGFSQLSLESHLTIIGLLENLKSIHQEKIKTLLNKIVKKEDNGDDVN